MAHLEIHFTTEDTKYYRKTVIEKELTKYFSTNDVYSIKKILYLLEGILTLTKCSSANSLVRNSSLTQNK